MPDFYIFVTKFYQLESRIAKLEQKLLKFPCYSKIPKPFDQPDETDIIAVRDIFNKAKQEVIDAEDMEARKYLTSDECYLFLDDLLWMLSKTVLQKIKEEKDELHESLIC